MEIKAASASLFWASAFCPSAVLLSMLSRLILTTNDVIRCYEVLGIYSLNKDLLSILGWALFYALDNREQDKNPYFHGVSTVLGRNRK